MKEWLKRPLTEMTAGLAAREVSAEELMRATLQRIEETQSSLNCFTCLADEELLLDQARQADSRIAAGEGRELAERNHFSLSLWGGHGSHDQQALGNVHGCQLLREQQQQHFGDRNDSPWCDVSFLIFHTLAFSGEVSDRSLSCEKKS